MNTEVEYVYICSLLQYSTNFFCNLAIIMEIFLVHLSCRKYNVLDSYLKQFVCLIITLRVRLKLFYRDLNDDLQHTS